MAKMMVIGQRVTQFLMNIEADKRTDKYTHSTNKMNEITENQISDSNSYSGVKLRP